jgi:transcriptional regulator with XRE-family HTH domain
MKKPALHTDVPHIGNMLKTYIHAKRFSQAALGRKIGSSPTGVIKTFEQENPRVYTLWAYCEGLEYDFFQDLSLLLPAHYRRSKSDKTSEQQEIELLQRRNEEQAREIAFLKELLFRK